MTNTVSAAQPWMNPALSPDERAALVLKEMTQAEKFSLVHGIMPLPFRKTAKDIPAEALGSAGYVPGVPRLGIPAQQESDAGVGVANPQDVRPHDQVTALPSGQTTAASFDPAIAYAGGALVGKEAHAKGFNVQLAGGVNLARDPRGGRNFEYLGEDPLLAGVLDGAYIRGLQDQHVISTIKHFAMNDQETHRNNANSVIDEAAMRESDLLAFEIAIEQGHPGSVMCSYNLVNGAYACGNDHLLNGVLKGDWKYPGWVMSDWGAVHALDYAMKGLDQQSAVEFDIQPFFKAPLQKAVADGTIPQSRLDDMVHRILRSMFAVGVIDHPAKKAPIDLAAHAEVAQQTAEAGMVLLKNAGVLPLARGAKRIAVIGGYADTGVISGGGSSQVKPDGSVTIPLGGRGGASSMHTLVLHPSVPLEAIRKMAPGADVRYADGRYPSEASKLAKWAEVTVVFAWKWQGEAFDAADLTLPDGQDALIAAVAKANPNTIVVLETGNPVAMPWLKSTAAVLEAWYPGSRGAEAIADILFGKVNPSGRLPQTFPLSVAQTPRPEIPGADLAHPDFGADGHDPARAIDVHYTEGADVGYRWFAARKLKPLFSFGYGLSYTKFAYRNLKVSGGKTLSVTFDVTNTGKLAGKDVPQVYLTAAAGKPLLRLIGFSKVELKPGETRRVTLSADPRLLADFDTVAGNWRVQGGDYVVALSRAANDPVATAGAKILPAVIAP